MLRTYSGTEALLLLKDSRPDLVLLDLMLPGLSGEEVLPQLQGISVIVVSAKTAVQDKVGLLLGGAADYLTKPFDTKELLARVAVRLRDATGKDHIEAVWGIGCQYHADIRQRRYNEEFSILPGEQSTAGTD